MNAADLMTRFRSLTLFQQALVACAFFFVINTTYNYLVAGGLSKEIIYMSASASLLFMSVYYTTSVLVQRKSAQIEMRQKGPKKGLRKP